MRGGSGGGRKVRPTLPFKLTKELGGDGDSRGSHRGGRGGGRGGSFKRKNRRKEEREAKKHKPRPQFSPREDLKASKLPAERHNKRSAAPPNNNSSEAPSAGKKIKSNKDNNNYDTNRQQNKAPPPSKPSRPGGSRFNELVPAEDPEKVLQRELARKLGIKKKAKTGKKIKFGDEGDGMDELMAELGGLDDILDSGSDGGGGEEEASDYSDISDSSEEEDEEGLDDRAYLKMKKQKAAAVAAAEERKKAQKYSITASSDSEEGEDEDQEDSENEDNDDSHLGGLSEMNHEHDDLGFENSEEESEEESSGLEEESEEDSDGEMMLDSSGSEDDDDEEEEEGEETEEEKKPAVVAGAVSGGKYVPPAVRRAQLAAAGAGTTAAGAQPRSRDEELVMRRVRGLLNRMAETNLQGIVGELAELYQNEGRSVVGNAVASELLTAAAEGPRASDRFAAVAAAAVAGLAGLTNSPGVIATFTEKVALTLEQAMAPAAGNGGNNKNKNSKNSNQSEEEAIFSQGDSLAAGNLVQVLAHLYLSGALKSDLVYSLLDEWRLRFLESDVVAMAGLLGAAGLALRAADPERMKEFVVAVHARAAECTSNGANGVAPTAATSTAVGKVNTSNKKSNSGGGFSSSSGGGLSTRARVMLDLVVDIKNNRKREDGRKKAVQLDPAAAKWLRGCNVGAVALGGITWKKVLTGDKRGHWWMPTAADAAATLNTRNNMPGTGAGTAFVGGTGGTAASTAAVAAGIGSDAGLAAAELLKLASAMHMNTDSRRAVFCAVMGSEDAVDAFERLLRLGLKGDQEREIVRVTVECCLNEAAYNPYYAQLLIRLCNVAKGHKITLQYCLWDHFTEVSGMELRRMTNLARLTATCISSTCISITMLKSVDFGKAFSAREVMFWRLFFEFCLAGCKTDADVATIFSKIAFQQQLGALKIALGAFLKRSVGPWLANRDVNDPSSGGAQRMSMLLRRCRLAEKALLSKI